MSLERILFVGACNPPTDPGRVLLSQRFLRHVPVIYVDYPGAPSLKMIYGTFNRALLRPHPALRNFAEPLTDAMVDFFMQTQVRFTSDMQPHYIYSPREMTRWVKGIAEAIGPLEGVTVEDLIRIWAHEALRLFQDRLVFDEERRWTDEHIDQAAQGHFPTADLGTALKRPILYSNWLSKNYVPVGREELRDHVKARIKVFCEEELDVQLVLFNEVLDHVLRIDRIFRQDQGHLLLIGASGAGKTTLSRFVAWMNGLSVFQVKVHKNYTAVDFDEDLRNVLRRAGTKGEKIVFILDEGNVLDSAFLERMNTLLANGEVPGLFEGDEFTTLMTQCKEGSQRQGLGLDGSDELYKWFSKEVMRNLHVVFTMNPSESGLHDRAATSPALFNRCVLDWFGDWSNEARFQIGLEFTSKLDLDNPHYQVPASHQFLLEDSPANPTHREVLVNAFVHVHTSVQQAARKLQKRNGHSTHITPRHFIEFINQYVAVTNEKRSTLEEQQLHLNVGLRKIRETVEQVEEMQITLAEKSKMLNAKNEAANAKLKQMVQDQQEAETKKAASVQISKEIAAKKVFIAEKQTLVEAELAGVEPAIEEAKAAVSTIKKAHLTEIRALANPPKAIKLALESILCLLGERQTEWANIRGFIVRDDFVQLITEFNSEQVSDKVRTQMEKEYLSNPEYSYEAANRASKACGPLVKWAIAQVNYAGMLLKIEPLRNELKSFQKETLVLQAQADEIAELITQLEKSIAAYKDEYAILISEAQAIKTDLTQVTDKVDRSRALLSKLDVEKSRWAKGSDDFNAQMKTLACDVLVATAFQTYCGYFDQKYRASLMNNWLNHVAQSRLEVKSDLSVAEFLSTPEERQRWKNNNLPADDLCMENAIMLKRCIRYPLVIDPSGQATEFLLKEFSDRKITKTSFLDAAFRKNLESSLRFGNPLLVQDAESYDALLNPVLNREVRRTGGRVLITIGDQDIDLSPAFRVLLTTRNPSVEFSPDLCSRVTIVNFTVTPSSLQTQCLNKVLRCERPDVDAKRSDLLKLQGEFRLRLHQLESELLSTLNESKGSILDDNRVISQLETLKAEATEITRKAAETDQVIAEIDAVSQQYNPLAVCCTSIFFTLEQMQSVHFLYHYSLQFFLDIFNFVLTQNPNLKNVKEPHARLSIITVDLFHTIFARVAPGLLHDDRMPLALIFSNFKAHGTPEQFPEAEFSYFLKGSSAIVSALPDGYRRLVPNLVSEEQARAFLALSQAVPAFKDVLSDLQDNQDAVKEFIAAACPEENIPPFSALNDDKASHTAKYLRELLILQILRGDRVLTKAHTLVDEVLGKELLQKAELASDLETVVEHEIKPNTPILLCGVSGYDPSTHVNDLATATNKQCTNIAIGSAEVCRGSFLNFTSLILSFRASLLLTTPFLALPNLVDGCC